MQNIQSVSLLKTEFCESRGIEMTDEEFFILTITYPGFLVAIADDDFDTKEQELMKDILTNLLSEVYKEELTSNEYQELCNSYLDDFAYLFQNQDIWKDKFLNSLDFLKATDMKPLNESVQKLMSDIAEVTDGTSEVELKTIEFVTQNYLS